jgi:hypothetical protein
MIEAPEGHIRDGLVDGNSKKSDFQAPTPVPVGSGIQENRSFLAVYINAQRQLKRQACPNCLAR